MAHHFSPNEAGHNDHIRKLLDGLAGPTPAGPTGRFPEGKMNAEDMGEIAVKIGAENGKVVMDFGPSMGWIGFTREQAFEISRTLRKRAQQLA